MTLRHAKIIFLTAVAGSLLASIPAQSAQQSVPSNFWGLNFSFADSIGSTDLAAVRSVGLRNMRVTITWRGVQPRAGFVAG